MVMWNPEKLTKNLWEHVVRRIGYEKPVEMRGGLACISPWGNFVESGFIDDEEKLFIIRVTPSSGKVNGLARFLENDIATEHVFSGQGVFARIGRKKDDFSNYRERIQYVGYERQVRTIDGRRVEAVSIMYRVEQPLLKLTSLESLRTTVYEYALLPILDRIQKGV